MSKLIVLALLIHRTMPIISSLHQRVFSHSSSHSLKHRNKMLIDLYFTYLWSAVIQDLYAEWYGEKNKQFLGPAPGAKNI